MKILLDTHAFLWLIQDADQLSKKAQQLFLDEGNIFLLSTASLWEMAIKISLSKLEINQPFHKFVTEQLHINKIQCLGIKLSHLNALINLPFLHRDPFDRLLVAQAVAEDIPILSSDSSFKHYSIKQIW